MGFGGLIVGLKLFITSLDLAGIEIISLEGLLQGKEVFGSVVALKGFGDFSFRFAAMVIAELSQAGGVVFAGDNSPDDLEAGLAGDVRDDLGEFKVHQLQGFLHMLNMLGAALNEVGAVAGVGSEGAHLFVGVEGTAQ